MIYRQIKAIEEKNKQRILQICPGVRDVKGIYFFTRKENGFKYAYVGQAEHLLTRMAQHLSGYQHIDLSIKKHGLYSFDNPTGWKANFVYVENLDEAERYFIRQYADAGYQLRNKTSGGQDEGKFGISDNKPARGYRDGLAQGYENARREVRHLFELHLNASVKKCGNKNQEKALQKFRDFLEG